MAINMRGAVHIVTRTKNLIVFSLLRLEMEKHAHAIGVFEKNFPLRRFGHVPSQKVRCTHVWIDILVVTGKAKREIGKGIQALASQVVDRPDDFRPFATRPSRIAISKIDLMGCPIFNILSIVGSVVEVNVGQKVLWRIGASLEKPFARSSELQLFIAEHVRVVANAYRPVLT